jgi:hypothetical protein
MGILRLQKQKKKAASVVNGRAYFRKVAREMHISGMDPDALQALDRPKAEPGPKKSRVGGHIAWNLRHLSVEETNERALRSEKFLKQEPVVFAAEEEDGKP